LERFVMSSGGHRRESTWPLSPQKPSSVIQNAMVAVILHGRMTAWWQVGAHSHRRVAARGVAARRGRCSGHSGFSRRNAASNFRKRMPRPVPLQRVIPLRCARRSAARLRTRSVHRVRSDSAAGVEVQWRP
jgi:hypothetical protein